jgi:hypothetical protein
MRKGRERQILSLAPNKPAINVPLTFWALKTIIGSENFYLMTSRFQTTDDVPATQFVTANVMRWVKIGYNQDSHKRIEAVGAVEEPG